MIWKLFLIKKYRECSIKDYPFIVPSEKTFSLEIGNALGYSTRHVTWAVNSAGECYLHTVEVTGSIPVPPTMKIKGLAIFRLTPFLFL